jgi:hypothetical protein
MKIHLSFILSLFLITCSLKAQDTLYKISGEKRTVKIIEVSSSQIKYKRSGDADGPLYVLKTSEVEKVVYPDGHTDVFVTNKKSSSDKKNEEPFPSDNALQRKHFIGINIIDLMSGILTLNYEANIYRDLLSLRIPLSFGIAALSGTNPGYNTFSPDFFYYSRDKLFSTGLDLRYFPFGQKRASYFIGPAYEYGQVGHLEFQNIPQPIPESYPPSIRRRSAYTALGISNGFQVQATDHLCMTLYMTLGSQLILLDRNESNYRALFRAGFVIGWRFGKQVDPPKKK